MPNSEPMRLSYAAERQTFQEQRYRCGSLTGAARAPFPPLVEQLLLFTFFAGAASFWVAVIWWIVR